MILYSPNDALRVYNKLFYKWYNLIIKNYPNFNTAFTGHISIQFSQCRQFF